ncbi:hypothetical protein DBV15_11298 [Temnothorax longispinosus]|uniref:Uncharacterized protein n=1 Tax=Temnothorax longispinosus TaxID=300112 RepID=A0A4V3S9R9_9HYME|nr:hypothetical protein DBV15_11298 [Temnothorax longispinosus]
MLGDALLLPALIPSPLVGENGSLFPRFLCTDPGIIVGVGGQ